MEIVGPPPADIELHLVPDLSALTGVEGSRRQRTAGVASVATHLALIVVLAIFPFETVTPTQPRPVARQHITPLIEPPSVLTQKAPNPGKTSKEFRAAVSAPRSPAPAPRTAPAAVPVRETPRPAPPPPAPAPPATPPVAAPRLPDPPKVEAPNPPRIEQPQLPVSPPQIQAEERPKNPFERPGEARLSVPPSQRQIPIPDATQAIRGGGLGGAMGSQGISPGATLSGQGSDVELPALLSDPQGVDFRPYLTRLLATVKRNWMTVWPESAKIGRRGRVGVQFAVAKDGTVTKVVWAFQSGADALDRAAVAAISMSNPFPPLPSEFKGDRIVLQFNFAYNMPRE